MAVTFDPQHTYVLWPDFTGTHGRAIKADQLEVTAGGAIIFSSRGDDGVMYATRVVAADSYAHVAWYGDVALDENTVTPL
jgi:hypothetical protein